MKHLKVKTMVGSLLAIAAMAVFTTSCNRVDLLTNDITAVNPTTIAEKLAQNPNFKAGLKMHTQIGNNLMKFIEEDNINNSNTEDVVASFIKTNTVNQAELELYKTNLFNEMPELKYITAQTFEEAFALAHSTVSEQKVFKRNCSYLYQHCVYVAYFYHYYGDINYQTYYNRYINCINEFYRCYQ